MGLITQGWEAAKKAALLLDAPQGLPAPRQSSGAEMVERVLQFVPVEVVGIYVGLTGAVAPKTPLPQWLIYLGSAVLVPIFLYLGSTQAVTEGWTGDPRRRLFHLSWMGIFALTGWVLAMPSNPFLYVLPNATQWGTGALIVLTALLPAVARKMNLA